MLPYEILDVEGFKVFNENPEHGGFKGLVLSEYLRERPEEEFVITPSPYGIGHLAFAFACAKTGKKGIVLFDRSQSLTYQFEQSSCVEYRFVESPVHEAETYSQQRHAFRLPLAFNVPGFCDKFVQLVRELPLKPREVWMCAGSGRTVRNLCEAWPEAEVNAVSINQMNCDTGRARLFYAPEQYIEPARDMPPYRSSPFFDAKVWRFVKQYGSPGAMIWNIDCPSVK